MAGGEIFSSAIATGGHPVVPLGAMAQAVRQSSQSRSAFEVYWDFNKSRYVMFEPQVCVPGASPLCLPTQELEFGKTYYCHVKYYPGTDVVDCVVNDNADGPGDGSSITEGAADEVKNIDPVEIHVKVVRVPPEVLSGPGDLELHQYHVGAVVVGGGGGGSVEVTGTDMGTVTGTKFKIVSGEETNMTCKAKKDETTGVVTLEFTLRYV